MKIYYHLNEAIRANWLWKTKENKATCFRHNFIAFVSAVCGFQSFITIYTSIQWNVFYTRRPYIYTTFNFCYGDFNSRCIYFDRQSSFFAIYYNKMNILLLPGYHTSNVYCYTIRMDRTSTIFFSQDTGKSICLLNLFNPLLCHLTIRLFARFSQCRLPDFLSTPELYRACFWFLIHIIYIY